MPKETQVSAQANNKKSFFVLRENKVRKILLLLTLFLVYYIFFSFSRVWLIPTFHQSAIHQHDYLQHTIERIRKSPNQASLQPILDLENDGIEFPKYRVKLNITKKPTWPIQFAYSKNYSAARHYIKITTLEKVNISIQLFNGKWLNYSSIPHMWNYPALVFIFMLFILVIALLLQHIWFVTQLSSALDRISFSAQKLKLNIHSKLNNERRLPAIKNTIYAMRDMQAYIVKLVTQKTYILGMISHDLKQPLMRLQFKIHQLNKSHKIKEIESDIHELNDMIENLIEYTRDNVHNDEKCIIDVVSLLWNCCDEFTDQGYDLHMELPNQTAPVWGSTQALKRCFNNIIGNACKYGRQTTSVKLTINHKHMIIKITDDGPGVAEEELKQLTKPFFRTSSGKAQAKGSGLGLAIVQEIIVNHNGELGFQNHNHSGLVVQVKLPLTEVQNHD